jgi:hypothetical protein
VRRLACLLGTVAAALLGGATPARASTLDLFGFGMRSPALAGAGVASADDYEAVYANPAGLGHTRHKRATVGALVADFALRLDDADAGVDTATGLVLGGALPVPLGGAATDRVGLGFGFYVPNSAINRAQAPFPGEPTYVLLANRAHVVAVQVGLGARITDRWSVGLGVVALAVLRGHIDVSTDAAGRFVSSSEQQLLTRFAPILGGRAQLGAVTLGLTARAPSRSDYDIQVTTALGDALPLELPPIRIAGASQYDPLTIAAEAAWRRGALLASAQLAYQRWSAFPPPTLNAVSGSPAQQPPDFHDTAVPRLAVEWTHAAGRLELVARGGYALLLSPAGEQRGQQSLLDNHRHLLALGGGVALGGRLPVRLDAFAQLHLLQPRRHTKDPGLQVGDAPVPFDSISTGGHVLVVGAALGVDL